MSARADILAAVRAALVDAPPPPEVPRGYRAVEEADAGLLDLFVERVEEYQATVVRCSASDVAPTLAHILDGAGRVVAADGLPWALPGVEVDGGLSARQLDAVDCAVTAAAVGIARTGTIVLDHGSGQGRRVLTLVPDRHVCIIRSAQVVAGVPQAMARLDPDRPQTWISGPSATSDIELTRVEGVHGPRRLVVLLVEDAPV